MRYSMRFKNKTWDGTFAVDYFVAAGCKHSGWLCVRAPVRHAANQKFRWLQGFNEPKENLFVI